MPYYLKHLAIACAISAVAWALALSPILYGAMFYLGREVRDREKLGRWDWPGLLWPVLILGAAEVALRLAAT